LERWSIMNDDYTIGPADEEVKLELIGEGLPQLDFNLRMLWPQVAEVLGIPARKRNPEVQLRAWKVKAWFLKNLPPEITPCQLREGRRRAGGT
jgi:hypothetical protein